MTNSIKLYGAGYSTCTKRVLLVAAELGIEIELVNTDLSTGAHKTPEFLKLQPFGQIPALIDSDGTVLYESRAISRYLAKKYGKGVSPLYPLNDDKQFGLVEQWISVEQSNYDPSISGLTYEGFFKPVFYSGVPDPAAVEAHRKKVAPILDVYETHLSTHKYLAGDHLTIADLFHIPYGYCTYTKTPNADLFDSRPHLKAWFLGLINSPKAAKILA